MIYEKVTPAKFQYFRNKLGLTLEEYGKLFSIACAIADKYERENIDELPLKDFQRSIYYLISKIDPTKGGYNSWHEVGEALKKIQDYKKVNVFLESLHLDLS